MNTKELHKQADNPNQKIRKPNNNSEYKSRYLQSNYVTQVVTLIGEELMPPLVTLFIHRNTQLEWGLLLLPPVNAVGSRVGGLLGVSES